MKKTLLFLLAVVNINLAIAQDWNGILVPPSPGSGMNWELQEAVSDDFNYESPATTAIDTIEGKWINWYHNPWTGPKPTQWQRDHISVTDGKMTITTDRIDGDSVTVDGQKLARTYLGCATSTTQVEYPAYVETKVKIMKSVLASNVWMLSSDDTQEIDICEAYGGDRWNNSFFSNKRLHLSHHVFIRQPFQDWQPSDAGSFYTNDTTVWSDDYHRIGVHWIDPWNLKYYVDGELVRERSGKEEIDPVYFTNAIDQGDPTNDTRTGMSKPMDIIINTEDQTWRALQGLTPTDDEMDVVEDQTFKVDWVRVYKPVAGPVGPVVSVTLDPPEVTTYIGNEFDLTANVEPYNALDLSVVWESDNPDVATVSQDGTVNCLTVGETNIIVTTNENNQKDTCHVSVNLQAPAIEYNNEESYLTTDYNVGGFLFVSVDFQAGTGDTIVEGDLGGVKFWLREVTQNWDVVNDYLDSDPSAIGKQSGTANGVISLNNVPPSADLPNDNFYFLYATFKNSSGDFIDLGLWPINIVQPTNVTDLAKEKTLNVFPNPAQDILNIQPNILNKDFSIQLLSASGQVLFSKKIAKNTPDLEMDISALPSGYFVIRVVADRVFTSAFVKK